MIIFQQGLTHIALEYADLSTQYGICFFRARTALAVKGTQLLRDMRQASKGEIFDNSCSNSMDELQ
jgi:hypothetical protein